MKDLTYDEYGLLVIDPLFYSIADGFYEGCKDVSERFGIKPPSKEDCTRIALYIWQDEEMYEWVYGTMRSLGIDVPCRELEEAYE